MVSKGGKIKSVIVSLFALNIFIPTALGLSFSQESSPELGQLKGFKGSELCRVAENTRYYLETQPQDHFAVHPGKMINNQVTMDKVQQTLAFICRTYREDVRAKRNSRLHDKAFLTEHFRFVRWLPDKKTATEIAGKSSNAAKSRMLNGIPEDEIFLTKYYTKLLDGSPVKTGQYDQALYALPEDEQGLSLAQAEGKKEQLTRFRFSRQQVIAGALLKDKLAKPLVWLTEEALHDVLLQGTGVLKVDGKIRYFNVHRNNGISYDYSIGKREQPRYWYFVETPEIMGYGHDQPSKIAIKPQVTFAGNIAALGVGKLIMVSYLDNNQQVSRLGILADQGGAFDNNLFQLDLLVDSYRGWSDYHSHNAHLPDYARAWILLLK
ncbi:MltA domain-containing protein [Thalassomonas haliotis]|uniref:MltA domain-containing protein n=1 Tax=Thalassomonas haliotis TaxID=485448 RepID=A0ABY7VD85_9GAMM|nr:MltA domain-containing protein [Thalassomonas haliotis]WDE11643.1 MltA domain-containing protein [Thalassomonas haliotis]